jgi:acyl transferase domain-containing protein
MHCRFHLQDFDAAPFGLSESEAVMVDPQQRLLLEAASGMLAAASAPLQQLQQQRAVGVFIGISNPDYADLKKSATPIGVYSATGWCQHAVNITPILMCHQLTQHNTQSAG